MNEESSRKRCSVLRIERHDILKAEVLVVVAGKATSTDSLKWRIGSQSGCSLNHPYKRVVQKSELSTFLACPQKLIPTPLSAFLGVQPQ